MEKLRTLIVEDDKTVAGLYNIGLIESVFEKRFAASGSTALELYHSWKPDLIILDIMLPEMSGYSVLKKIRQEAGDNSTTVIMASSLSSKMDVTGCLELGIQGYIIKPFKFKTIGEKVLEYYEKADPIRGKEALSALRETLSKGLES